MFKLRAKKFPVPPFEEWYREDEWSMNHKYIHKLGDYWLHIRWETSNNKEGYTVYCLGIDVELYSRYSIGWSEHKVYDNDKYKIEKLKAWYERAVEEANLAFEKYLLETYFE